MPCPLPGMDPYLESDKLWPAFQHQLVSSLYQILLPGLVDRYRARLGQRSYVTEQPLFTSIIREQHTEDFIEVRQRADNRLVTLIDMVSPINKARSQGRAAYLESRKQARAQNASVVEIDLVLHGQPMLDYSREGLPAWDYAITVTRSTQPERYEIYTTTLQKRLPRFKIPLAADDRDTVLDLQATFARCYDQANFSTQIDYQNDPALKLKEDDLKWLGEVLRLQKLR
ncbi:MAG: DUF4058 family protein [Planctomycetes bacterium]|nr:DUF4058 family protein [Planctomycetota bacterium]